MPHRLARSVMLVDASLWRQYLQKYSCLLDEHSSYCTRINPQCSRGLVAGRADWLAAQHQEAHDLRTSFQADVERVLGSIMERARMQRGDGGGAAGEGEAEQQQQQRGNEKEHKGDIDIDVDDPDEGCGGDDSSSGGVVDERVAATAAIARATTAHLLQFVDISLGKLGAQDEWWRRKYEEQQRRADSLGTSRMQLTHLMGRGAGGTDLSASATTTTALNDDNDDEDDDLFHEVQ